MRLTSACQGTYVIHLTNVDKFANLEGIVVKLHSLNAAVVMYWMSYYGHCNTNGTGASHGLHLLLIRQIYSNICVSLRQLPLPHLQPLAHLWQCLGNGFLFAPIEIIRDCVIPKVTNNIRLTFMCHQRKCADVFILNKLQLLYQILFEYK